MNPTKQEILELKTEFEKELFKNVLPFWEKYSVDSTYGGYFNCLDRYGKIYDTTKHSWLQARQIWMFSKLYNEYDPKKSWIKISEIGFNFLRNYAKREDNRIYFSLSADGKPIYLQRKIFSECFYTIALAQYAKAVRSTDLRSEVDTMYNQIWELAFSPGMTGREKYVGDDLKQSLAVPMILLNVIEEITEISDRDFGTQILELIGKIKLHFINQKMYENITISGDQVTTSEARLMNPGHSIEAGWFLLHWAKALSDDELLKFAAEVIRSSFEIGWDKKYGGLFYFLDAEGYSPTQLEWDMKLWWPHCEAMYAFLLLYTIYGEQSDWIKFKLVKDYTFNHFSDPEFGEWFGYLNRRGEVTHKFKGGPYKGCFHVPRSLYYCMKLLEKLENTVD